MRPDDERRREEPGTSDTARLETFSDGVMAIAITLLILGVRVPHVDRGLGSAILRAWPDYVAYVTSFLTIGIIWANHHRMFKLIARSTWPFLMINVLFLMVVVFIPLPTALVAEYLRVPAERMAAVLFYGITMILAAVMFNAVWIYASRGRRLLAEEVDLEAIRKGTKSYRMGPALYAATTLVALANPLVAVVIYLLLAAYWLLPGSGPG